MTQQSKHPHPLELMAFRNGTVMLYDRGPTGLDIRQFAYTNLDGFEPVLQYRGYGDNDLHQKMLDKCNEIAKAVNELQLLRDSISEQSN